MDRCDECGFVYDLGRAARSGAAITGAATEASTLILGAGVDAARRRRPPTWSALEYACHLRDVLFVQRERVLLARRVPCPTPEPMGRDERVEQDGYREQLPADVARQLRDAALLFANVLGRLSAPDWERTLVYNYPTPRERTLRWVALHTQHEVEHHLGDIRQQLEP